MYIYVRTCTVGTKQEMEELMEKYLSGDAETKHSPSSSRADSDLCLPASTTFPDEATPPPKKSK